jgi:hypothetical protein
MPRTFSLAGLMVGVTLLCLVCGLAVNYPVGARVVALVVALIAILIAPTVIVWLGLMRLSRHRIALTFTSVVGGMLGFVLWIGVVELSLFGSGWAAIGLFTVPAIGALFLSGIMLVADVYLGRRE